jgi:hypothetical protein
MDLSLSIAVGSSLQIALFITPVLIFASYLFGLRMTLEFSLPEVAALSLAVRSCACSSATGKFQLHALREELRNLALLGQLQVAHAAGLGRFFADWERCWRECRKWLPEVI